LYIIKKKISHLVVWRIDKVKVKAHVKDLLLLQGQGQMLSLFSSSL